MRLELFERIGMCPRERETDREREREREREHCLRGVSVLVEQTRHNGKEVLNYIRGYEVLKTGLTGVWPAHSHRPLGLEGSQQGAPGWLSWHSI